MSALLCSLRAKNFQICVVSRTGILTFVDVYVRYKVRYPITLWQMADMLLDNFCQELSLGKLAKNLTSLVLMDFWG